MGRKNERLTLVAARKPQLKKRGKRDWSKEKAAAFLDVLGQTCNVSEACRQTGVPMTVAYRQRRLDASFRAAWVEAIAIGYQRLEALLIDRAFNGTERIVTRKDGGEERVREYPNQIALHLLKMHRETAMEADTEMAPDDIAEIRARLVNKLQRLKRRDEEQEAERAGVRRIAPRNGDTEECDGGAAAPRD